MSNFKDIHRKIGVVILAAGESSRMLNPKPFLPYNEELLFIDKIIKEYRSFGCEEIICTTNTKHVQWADIISRYKDVKFIVNDHPEYERFYSVKLGLSKAKDLDYCFVQNIDNPFINDLILNMLYAEKETDSYITPMFEDKGGHPILLGKKAMFEILNEKDNCANLKKVLEKINRKKASTTDGSILININTTEAYSKYCGRNFLESL